jgi:hypothetical protein
MTNTRLSQFFSAKRKRFLRRPLILRTILKTTRLVSLILEKQTSIKIYAKSYIQMTLHSWIRGTSVLENLSLELRRIETTVKSRVQPLQMININASKPLKHLV